jgi:hypothetical protein
MILIPKIQSIKTHNISDWKKIYSKELDYIINSFIYAIQSFTSDNYILYLNIEKIKQNIINTLYISSQNKHKNFILGNL